MWDTNYLSPSVYMTSAATIDTYLTGDPTITLLVQYGAGYMGNEFIRCCKTVYVPTPYVGLLLGDDLTLIEDRNRL